MPRPMGGKGGQNFEQAKDFRGAMKKLVHYLNKFHKLLVIAFALAAVSAILSIIAPDRLSDMTDLISDGLVPNISENTVTEIMSDSNISNEDKIVFASIMTSITEDSTSGEIFAAIDEMPEYIKSIVKPQMHFAAIKSIALFLAIVYIASAIFSFFQHFIMATVSNNFAKDLRGRIITKINKLISL